MAAVTTLAVTCVVVADTADAQPLPPPPSMYLALDPAAQTLRMPRPSGSSAVPLVRRRRVERRSARICTRCTDLPLLDTSLVRTSTIHKRNATSVGYQAQLPVHGKHHHIGMYEHYDTAVYALKVARTMHSKLQIVMTPSMMRNFLLQLALRDEHAMRDWNSLFCPEASA